MTAIRTGESGHSGEVLSRVTNILSTRWLLFARANCRCVRIQAQYCRIFDVSKETRKPKYLCEISGFGRVRNAFQILEAHVCVGHCPGNSTLETLANLWVSR